MGTLVSRALLGVCLFASSLLLSAAPQTAAVSTAVGDPVLFILFLSQHAQDASRRASGVHGPNSASRAAQLHIKPADLSLVDQKALAYVTEGRKIHEEALQYREACIRANKPLDPAVVHSFTTRREAQAAAAFSEIRSELSPASYAGLEQYLTSVFMKSLKRQSVR